MKVPGSRAPGPRRLAVAGLLTCACAAVGCVSAGEHEALRARHAALEQEHRALEQRAAEQRRVIVVLQRELQAVRGVSGQTGPGDD